MKFCKKCHRRIIDVTDNNIQFSPDSIRICFCPGRVAWIRKSVDKRARCDYKDASRFFGGKKNVPCLNSAD